MKRREFLKLSTAVIAAAASPVATFAQSAPREVRIGYQKTGVLVIARQQGTIEKRFAASGVSVKWIEFTSGPPLLEAISNGAADFGAVGDSPPIFAQAANANIVYAAASPISNGQGILVPPGSSIRTIADLKGRRVGFTKGSSAHNIVVQTLEKAGLTYEDITPVYLTPPDAGPAFANGSIDAWAVWDPYFAIGEKKQNARILINAYEVAKTNAFFIANRDFASKQPGLLREVIAGLAVAADQAAIDADQVQLGFTTITAPISGRLGAVSVSVGDLVTAGGSTGTGATPLVTITEMDPLRVAFNLPEADLSLLQQAVAKPGSVSVTLHKDGTPAPIGSGTVDFVNSTVDTASGTITARATVPNADLKLWPGQYVNVTVNAGIMPQVVTVPTQAVQPSQQGSFVYVVKPDNTVEARPVKVAISHENESAIASGLQDGDKVVVDGQLSLKPGTAVRAAEGAGKNGTGGSTSPKAAVKANGNETAG